MNARFSHGSPDDDSSADSDAVSPRNGSGLLSELIGVCIAVQGRLGPGCPRTVYVDALVRELREHGIFATKRPSAGRHGFFSRGSGLRAAAAGSFDLVIEGILAVELADLSEASFRRDPARRLDQFTLRLERQGMEAGLLIDFDQPDPTNGIWLARARTEPADRQDPLTTGAN